MLVLHPAPQSPDQNLLISQPPLSPCSREVNFRAAIKNDRFIAMSNAVFLSFNIYELFASSLTQIKISVIIKIKYMRFLASYVILLALKLNVMFYATSFAIKNATLGIIKLFNIKNRDIINIF